MIDFITNIPNEIMLIFLMIWGVLYFHSTNKKIDAIEMNYKKEKKAEELKAFSDKFNAPK